MAGVSLLETPDSSSVHSSTRRDTKFINHLHLLECHKRTKWATTVDKSYEYSNRIQILPDRIFWLFKYVSLIILGLLHVSLCKVPRYVTTYLSEKQILRTTRFNLCRVSTLQTAYSAHQCSCLTYFVRRHVSAII